MGVFQAVWPVIQDIAIVAWNVITAVIETVTNVIMGIIKFLPKCLLVTGKVFLIQPTNSQRYLERYCGIFESIDLFDIGKSIIQGLITGISSMITAVWDKVTDIARGIGEKFRSALKIFSPSQLFEGYGIDTMLGYQIGFEDQAQEVNYTVENTADDIATTFRPDSKPTTTNTSTASNSFSPHFEINVFRWRRLGLSSERGNRKSVS